MGGPLRCAAQAVVDGDLAALQDLLRADPGLVHGRTGPPFEATLLHYSAANGVEDQLQRSPENAPELARALLAAGAEPDALGTAYGGGPNATPLCLLVSSWHPFAAGVQAELVRVLVEGGARLEGVAGDGAPLAMALTFGYTGAARALAACGARTDNLLFAAGLGDLLQVQALLTADLDTARGHYQPVYREAPPRDRPEALLQEALHLAVTHGQEPAAQELLAAGAKADAPTQGHHAALPLVQALFVREFDVLPLLLEHGADPRAQDPKLGRSALDYAAQVAPEEVQDLLHNRRP